MGEKPDVTTTTSKWKPLIGLTKCTNVICDGVYVCIGGNQLQMYRHKCRVNGSILFLFQRPFKWYILYLYSTIWIFYNKAEIDISISGCSHLFIWFFILFLLAARVRFCRVCLCVLKRTASPCHMSGENYARRHNILTHKRVTETHIYI